MKMRLSQSQKPTLSLKTKIIRAAVISIMSFAVVLTVIFNVSFNEHGMAAAAGDYRSAGTGNWNNAATWETYNGVSWLPAIATPTSANGVITIQSGHTVTVTASVTVDQVTVPTGGILTVSAGTLTIANGAGSDLDIKGTVNKNAGTLTISIGARVTILSGGIYNFNGGTQTSTGWIVNNGGTYVHNVNGITIPTATWGTSSTLKITGVTTSDVTGTYQDFGNVIYDCPNQTCCPGGGSGSTLEFTGDLKSIAGDFTVLSTGTGGTWLQKNSTTTPVTISGNYFQSGGTVFMAKGATFSWNLMGNFLLTGGMFVQAERYSMPTLNVYGNFTITGGTFNHSQYNSNLPNEGVGTVNLYGNYIRTGGLHTETATQTGHGEFNFTKTGTQTFSHTGGSITNTVNFTVTSVSVTDLADYMITGGGTFTLQSGGGLILGSANGITSSGASGNIQVTGIRSYSTGGDYTYAGTSAQVTGNGLPGTVHNLTFNNPDNVTMISSSSATSIITFINGKVVTNTNELGSTNTSVSGITGYSSSSYVVGNLRRSMAVTGLYDFPVGVLSNYELANIKLTGMAGFTDILGFFTNTDPIEPAFPLTDIYVGITPITDMLNYGYWTFTPNSAMTSGDYTVTLNEKGHSNSASNPYEYCVLKRPGLGSYWQSVGTHNNNTQSETGGVATAARSSLDAFSHFGIGKGGGGGPLPVKMISFTARMNPQNENTVLLSWTTAAETNNDYFTVQRSVDGKKFSELTRVNGSGSTTTIHKYSFIDEHPYDGTTYYRLKQTDFNGASQLFKIASVTIRAKQSAVNALSISPNPFSDSFTARFESQQEGEVKISIFSLNGTMIHTAPFMAEAGIDSYHFTAGSAINDGTYILRVASPVTVIATGKIICKK